MVRPSRQCIGGREAAQVGHGLDMPVKRFVAASVPFSVLLRHSNRTMTPYGVVIDMQSIHLPHIRFAWPEIMRLAKRFCGPGHKIRVKDDDAIGQFRSARRPRARNAGELIGRPISRSLATSCVLFSPASRALLSSSGRASNR